MSGSARRRNAARAPRGAGRRGHSARGGRSAAARPHREDVYNEKQLGLSAEPAARQDSVHIGVWLFLPSKAGVVMLASL
ncbi:unnamed protein product [Colias eurytheme]|nr:unnamed protein product [Colias eurytheme]